MSEREHLGINVATPRTTATTTPIFIQTIIRLCRRCSEESVEAIDRWERVSRILCSVCSKRMLKVGFWDTGGGTFRNSSSVAVSIFSNCSEFLSTSDQVAMKRGEYASQSLQIVGPGVNSMVKPPAERVGGGAGGVG